MDSYVISVFKDKLLGKGIAARETFLRERLKATSFNSWTCSFGARICALKKAIKVFIRWIRHSRVHYEVTEEKSFSIPMNNCAETLPS